MVECVLQGRFPGLWTGPPVGAVGHPFAAQVGGMECCDKRFAVGGINQKGRPRHGWGS